MDPQYQCNKRPVAVLDFQSLYPSMVISNNLCYSTIIGKLQPLGGSADKLGVMGWTPDRMKELVKEIGEDNVFIAPNGSVFCKPQVRKGVLGEFLREILKTRVAVKGALKMAKAEKAKVLARDLDAVQLALKLVANVTYGYTAASFSGRMPMSELADAIVESGKKLLSKCKDIIEDGGQPWAPAQVAYGDTDSLFVACGDPSDEGPMKVSEAFDAATAMKNYITKRCHEDVVLKLEKVYEMSFLVTKKRYVGWSFEHIDQDKPLFDCKGLEMIRRDMCPLARKVQERAVKEFFRTKGEISQVRKVVEEDFHDILDGSAGVENFIIRQQFRDFEKRTPASRLAKERKQEDPNFWVPYKMKVPFILASTGGSKSRQTKSVDPLEVLRGRVAEDRLYYLEKKVIPPLDRVLALCEGVDVKQWYREMKKPVCRAPYRKHVGATLDRFVRRENCGLCGRKAVGSDLCAKCGSDLSSAYCTIQNQVAAAERRLEGLLLTCKSCAGTPVTVWGENDCISLGRAAPGISQGSLKLVTACKLCSYLIKFFAPATRKWSCQLRQLLIWLAVA